MSYKIIDSRADGQDVITTVEFYGVPENKKNKVTLEVRHYSPQDTVEIIVNLDDMELTSQHPKEKENEQESRANEIAQELKDRK